ncbi:TonB-dependent receptor plug domain-containing protein [Phenylobacterium sp.]|jgi:outer membrane receptor protein involved in Fe transport|uniref:TonB-dependent receptor plug domain-containing protein n=1 Tax=Phenylobacterium sp. TaxID=1871053 RepID=UPI002F95D385
MLQLLLLLQAAAPETAAQQGVISYPPSYFAAQQPNSAMDMLSRIPGFSFDAGSSVRGFEGAAGNVLIDGQRPSSKSDDLGSIIQRIPASQVERIDVIRGGAPGIDMQGKTVLANIIRKKGGGRRGMVQASDLHLWDGRDLIGLRADASGGEGRRKWELSLRHGTGLDDGAGKGHGARIYSDGTPTLLTDIDQEGDGRQYVASGSIETPLLWGDLRLNARALDDQFKFEDTTRYRAPATGMEQSVFHQDLVETEVGGRYSRTFGGDTDLELVALRTDRNRITASTFDDGTFSDFTLDRDTSETIGRGVLKHRFSQTLSVEAGGETALNTLASATALRVDGEAIDLPAGNVHVEEDRKEVFAKGTWRATSQLTFDGGVRYESSTITSSGDVQLEKTLRFLKPRMAVTWAPSETRQVRLRIERQVGQLNFGDFVASGNLNNAAGVTAGNPDLNPEQEWVYEAAFEQRFWGSGVVVLTLRHFQITDVIDRGPVFLEDGTVFDTPQNIGDGKRTAIILEYTIPFERLGLKGAQLKGEVRKRWTEVVDPTTGQTREISGIHPLDWQANFSHDIPSWKITWGVDVFGGFRETYYRFDSIENFKLHTYVQAYVEWKPSPQWNVRAELRNLTTRDLRDTFYIYPGAGRTGAPDIDDRLNFDTPGGVSIRIRRNFGA